MKAGTMVLAAMILTVGFGMGIWIGKDGQASTPKGGQGSALALTVSVVRAKPGAVAEAVQVVGTTRSREHVMVVPEIPGLRIAQIEAEAGDYVRAGQTLAVLDGRSQAIERTELRSEMERTREEYRRSETLVASQLVSREFHRQKASAYEVALAQYQNAQLSVQRTRVVAPASGLVFRRTASVGDLTDTGVVLFEIARDGVVEMQAEVPEDSVGRLAQGMAAQVVIAGFDKPIRGEIRLVVPNVDNASRTSEVRIRLVSDAKVPVGAFAQASIDLARIEGWSLPRSALHQDSAGAFVWVVDAQGVVKRRAVSVKLINADTAILADALGDAAIVSKAGAFLRENDRVAIVSPAVTSPPASGG